MARCKKGACFQSKIYQSRPFGIFSKAVPGKINNMGETMPNASPKTNILGK